MSRKAEMDDLLKIARKAHEAGEIYAAEKHAPVMGAATKDVYLVNHLISMTALQSLSLARIA